MKTNGKTPDLTAPGFYYEVSSEALADWSALTAEAKLRWLYQTNAFLRQLPKEIRERHERFRRGAI